VKEFARHCGIVDMEHSKKPCGPRWCYSFQDAIFHTALPPGTAFPSLALGLEESARKEVQATLLLGL
jgi:hypothetical protein